MAFTLTFKYYKIVVSQSQRRDIKIAKREGIAFIFENEEIRNRGSCCHLLYTGLG